MKKIKWKKWKWFQRSSLRAAASIDGTSINSLYVEPSEQAATFGMSWNQSSREDQNHNIKTNEPCFTSGNF